jgi:hypothetical protein
MSPDSNDWRLAVQHDQLKDIAWTWKLYRQPRPEWDHDHCEFCWTKFMEPGTPETFGEGYASSNDHYWVCRQCFDDFRGMFRWTLRGRLT